MRFLISLLFAGMNFSVVADTMENYLSIKNRIPQMEVRADPRALAWARSARSVLMITNDAIAETLLKANETLAHEKTPFFCLPPGKVLDANTLEGIIVDTYRSIASAEADKNKMTVSEVAWLGVAKTWPCKR